MEESDAAGVGVHAVFLRAINVGSRRITMADLREVFDDLGWAGTMTYQAAGNIIVPDADDVDRTRIEHAIEQRFGFRSEAFIRTGKDIDQVIAEVPWSPAEHTVEVSFLEERPDREAIEDLVATVCTPEALVVSGTQVYFRREGKGIEPVHREATTERLLGMRTTRRAFATVVGVAERMRGIRFERP